MVYSDAKLAPAGPKVLMLVGDWVEDYEAMVSIQALEMLNIVVDVVSPGKDRGQMVMSCIHDFDRSHIDGAQDVVFANSLGLSGGNPVGFQAVSERPGHAVLITRNFDNVDPADYSGLIVPGGRSPESLQLNETILDWVRRFFDEDKPVASICHGIQILAAAGVLDGRTCTGHPCCRPQAQSVGAIWEPTNLMDTVIDGNLITAAEWTATPGMLRNLAAAMGITSSYVQPAGLGRV
ncbi:DJ-1/PfpI family protein [Brevibacterium sp. UCMA 11754]|uniref:DJ-1/PfpI family protein n=1 Tax=Brevibacterium sp. UCMA 11754 TaxID=2749198 RepID=UPI001F1817B0|nr:DJ-1/PfpI family protein [Brevibacterium sp. UCMA 11754]MCF2574470.1 DJ-1/PfpI family protein [Brevibacterium sp. UCMA 11754]